MKKCFFKIVFIAFCLINSSDFIFAQNQSLYIKSWVKQNEVLLRWAPFNKDVFDLAVKNGYKLTRSDEAGNAVILSESIKPFLKEDTAWSSVIKSNENAVIALGVLYDNKVNPTNNIKAKKEQDLMVYNMMLLSCDFDAYMAKACGLFFRDVTIDNSKTYTYQLSINNIPSGSKVKPATITVNTSQLSKNPDIKNLQGIFKNRSVKLKWKAARFTNDFAAYKVERSKDSINYMQVNKSPIILLASEFEKKKENIFYIDTFPTVKEKYYYRIKGLNHFGEWSEPSNVLSAIGYEELRSVPVFDTIYTIKNQSVFMKWRMGNVAENESPKEYILTRAKKDNDKYEVVFRSQNKLEFIDENPNATNFYKVGAISYGGDTLFSFSYMALIIDTIPPAIPTGLKAKVDAKGNVTLTWDKNKEADVQGYKIFKSNALHEEFVQINNEFALEPTYKDKLNLKTLSKTIYYKVGTTDKRYNNSDLSEAIEVKRPDTIAPASPVITGLEMKPNGIQINWINSNSSDVRYYVLYRVNEKILKDEKVREWLCKDTLTSYLDTTLVMGEGYRYKLMAGDEDDNVSFSNSPYMKFETGFRKKLTEIKYVVDRKQKLVILNWNYPVNEIEKFIIYRCKKGGSLTIIKTLPGNTNSFPDTSLNMGNIYEYRIKPVFSNGAEGIISDVVEVEY